MNLHLLMESQVATLTDLTRCFYLVQQLKNSCALIDQELPYYRKLTLNEIKVLEINAN